jgi:hypothetical protein
MKTIAFTLLSVFLFVSCASSGPGPFRGASLSRISVGMSKQEVLTSLGEPKSVGAGDNAEVFHYTEDKGWWVFDHYYVRFVGGKVESYGPENMDHPVTSSEPPIKSR